MQEYRYFSDGCTTQLYKNAGKEFYKSEKNRLEKLGYNIYDENEIEGNLFSTYVSDNRLFQLCFTKNDDSVRLITDESMNCCPLNDPFERKNETVLWQFETDHSLIDCGMCYIIKCANGAFFIIDSAHFYSINDNDRIYSFLREHTPENEKIVIAGWFLSHAHDDHVTKFKDFLTYNAADVEIERIYCNFPATEYCDREYFMESAVEVIKNINIFLREQKKAEVVRLHTGQRFAVRNLMFTVLCTHEDVFPDYIENFNDSSTVLMLEAENTRVFFPGDAGELESIILEERYPAYLKCDILQVAHHGHFGLRASCYDLICAKLALVPTTRIKYDEEYEKLEATRRAVELAQRVYISAEGTAGIPLPLDMSKIVLLPDETNESFEGVYNLWGYEYSPQRREYLISQFKKRSCGC